jgi:hypothetical protein
LRDLLLYLSDRVLEDEAGEIHEQEVGHKVFGRPLSYDTGSDNIVRVHASLLRKRLDQYLAAEGAAEPLILEIPKGNYAPVFRQRAAPPQLPTRTDWRLWLLAGAAMLFACSTAYLLSRARAAARPPTVSLLWSRIFRPGQPTDIVLDDAVIGLYQDLAGRGLGLSDYFARDYLRTLSETGVAGKLDPQTAHSIILKRYSSYAGANLLWKLFQISGVSQPQTSVHSLGVQYPVDTWTPSASKSLYRTAEGYCVIALLPNLAGNGNVLIISGAGGSTTNAAADFPADEQFASMLRQVLPAAKDSGFPYFEVLLRVKGRSPQPYNTAIVVLRSPRG